MPRDLVPVVQWRWTPVVAYMAFIFALSSVATFPAVPGGSDKPLHALLYAGLSVLLIRALAGGFHRIVRPAMVLVTVVIAAAYGVSDEFHQSFVSSRHPDAMDVIADTIGAALAAGALFAWSRFTRRAEKP